MLLRDRELFSRSSSGHSGFFSRGSSKKSNRPMQEANRVVEGLTAFKAKLVASQRQTLQLLDSALVLNLENKFLYGC